MIIKNAEVFKEQGAFETGDIYISSDRISAVGSEDIVIDATGLYAIPGLTDIHFHGCMGYDLCDGTEEALDAITKYQARNGITTICPATMSLPEQQLSVILSKVSSYNNPSGAVLCGINLEGPFLSVKKKGAQKAEYICNPDMDLFHRLNSISRDIIKIVNIAPEERNAFQMIEQLHKEKVISIAHTTADYDTALLAFRMGARQVTHLYNAMPPLNHREPGVIGAAFDSESCRVELICDGIHIHPSVVRATIKMFGEDRVIFVSDSMMATGLSDGYYTLGGQEVCVTGKRAHLKDGTIAGSATNLMECMKKAVLEMGIPLTAAIKASAINPAKAIDIYEEYGSITIGKFANIILLDKKLNLIKVIRKGIEIDLSEE